MIVGRCGEWAVRIAIAEMKSFDDLVQDAEEADISGLCFG